MSTLQPAVAQNQSCVKHTIPPTTSTAAHKPDHAGRSPRTQTAASSATLTRYGLGMLFRVHGNALREIEKLHSGHALTSEKQIAKPTRVAGQADKMRFSATSKTGLLPARARRDAHPSVTTRLPRTQTSRTGQPDRPPKIIRSRMASPRSLGRKCTEIITGRSVTRVRRTIDLPPSRPGGVCPARGFRPRSARSKRLRPVETPLPAARTLRVPGWPDAARIPGCTVRRRHRCSRWSLIRSRNDRLARGTDATGNTAVAEVRLRDGAQGGRWHHSSPDARPPQPSCGSRGSGTSGDRAGRGRGAIPRGARRWRRGNGFDLPGLLCGVDVYGPISAHQSGEVWLQFRRRDRAQAVRGDAHVSARQCLGRDRAVRAFEQLRELV